MSDLKVSFPKPCNEKWGAMSPSGRARMCGRCDKAVHDLSEYGLDEAQALLRREPGACFRADIGADGVVALKSGRNARSRRMIVAAAITAGLLITGEPALAGNGRPRGAIAGYFSNYNNGMRVTVTDQAGRTYRTRVRQGGRFRITHLPAGTYTLTFHLACGNVTTVGNVIVGNEEVVLPDVRDSGGCIVIGMLQIEDSVG